MSLDTLKFENGLCRCCHSDGNHRNLAEPWMHLGRQEIYVDMLQECLNIRVNSVQGPLCTVTYTICEDCILRLRDACNFKQQVEKCEEQFYVLYAQNAIKLGSSYGIDVKEEKTEDATEVDIKPNMYPFDEADDDLDYSHDGDDRDYDVEIEIKKEQKSRTKKVKTKDKSKAKPKGSPRKHAVKSKGEDAEKEKKGDDVGEYVSVSGDNNKRFICKACEIAYRRLSDLRYHITRTHLKKKFIKCKHCAETFMYHSQRKCHVLSEHAKIKPEKFICDYCSRQFKRKNTLAEHVMDVHVEKKCSHCKLKFVRKRYLFHLNEAHGVAMPTCGVCGLRTLMESALIRHQRKVHLSEKNKICAVCKKGFYTESNLQDHMITHNQLKVFECDVCAKSFARRECFKAHYRIHTGERPYACKICALTFVQRASLRFHMKSHHQDINKSPQN